MKFELDKAIEVLERTPSVLRTLLSDLSSEWTHQNEGPDTWSPFDVVGHFIQGEETWIRRSKIILEEEGKNAFAPFDRLTQSQDSAEKNLPQLLGEFEQFRSQNLIALKALHIKEAQLSLKGDHPAFGHVTLSQLLSAWVTHDLGHITQITRVMAKQYKEEVGPWKDYFSVLNR